MSFTIEITGDALFVSQLAPCCRHSRAEALIETTTAASSTTSPPVAPHVD